MKVAEIRRYPVKSMLGEVLPAAGIGPRGLDGDRLWAVRDPDGKFGSGKNTRRFRRMEGLFRFRAYAATPAPLVELPDGRRFPADDPAGHQALSTLLGRDVTLTPETDIKHHDEGPVSLLTTAALRTLSSWTATSTEATPPGSGGPAEALRFRANLLIDADSLQDDWPGRDLRVGPTTVLRVIRPLTRCVMIDMAQESAPARNDLLKTLATHHNLTLGVVASVVTPGPVALGDTCAWI
ncbi:MOSC N-terminal beta barrel domain-containing protein [Actinoplanes sp. NPDC049596]|uniref:MOSC domain-containing protein n=1 Tax=unclassified Actinoplanes TaxID=2626549 RepID=UPI00344611DC